MTRRKKTRDGIELLKKWFDVDPDNDPQFQEIAADYDVAQLIYDARTAAGLTQQQLAEKVGTTQSVISQLEDADYEGHSLSMLRRVAAALSKRVRVELVALDAPAK